MTATKPAIKRFQEIYKHTTFSHYEKLGGWDGRPNGEDISFLSRYVGPEDIVLEVGCGSGKYTIELGQLCKRLIAIEPIERYANVTREKLAASGINATVAVTDVNALVNMPEQYDRILFGMVLSQLPNPRYALEISSKKLKTNGSIIVSECEVWPEPDGSYYPQHHDRVNTACHEAGCEFKDVERELGIPFTIDFDNWLKNLATDTSLHVKGLEYFGRKPDGRCFVAELTRDLNGSCE